MNASNFETVKSATQFLTGLRRRIHARADLVAITAHSSVTIREQLAFNVRKKRREPALRGGVLFDEIARDICTPFSNSLPANFIGVIVMAEQAIEAAEILRSTQALFQKQLHQFSEATDEAVKEAKQRVSQLNDYTNRLGTSLANLNKILGDERMARALENADKIAAALKLLDSLQQGGNLDKIIAALQAK